jgi:hypothetical protein
MVTIVVITVTTTIGDHRESERACEKMKYFPERALLFAYFFSFVLGWVIC